MQIFTRSMFNEIRSTLNFNSSKGAHRMESKRNIPTTFVGADTDPDIVALRNTLEGNKDVEVQEDGSLAVKTKHSKPGKKGDIPKGVLGSSQPGEPWKDYDTEIPEELISEFRPDESPDDRLAGKDQEKKGMIPKGVLGGARVYNSKKAV